MKVGHSGMSAEGPRSGVLDSNQQLNQTLAEKYDHLCCLLHGYGRVAVAWSGGVDSSLLAHAALSTLGKDAVLVLHGVSSFQSRHDLALVQRDLDSNPSLARAYQALAHDPLVRPEIQVNDERRCYHCKHYLYSLCRQQAKAQDVSHLLDGSNLDDSPEQRPGFLALAQLGVDSPLREAGLGKAEVRQLAGRFGLAACDRPANSCLATRIAGGIPLSPALLQQVAAAEDFFRERGFARVRVRLGKKDNMVLLPPDDLARVSTELSDKEVLSCFQQIGLSAPLFVSRPDLAS